MITEARKKSLSLFAEGQKLYRKRDFVGALKFFDGARQADETDEVPEVFIARCKELIENPPPDDWDGVFEMLTK